MKTVLSCILVAAGAVAPLAAQTAPPQQNVRVEVTTSPISSAVESAAQRELRDSLNALENRMGAVETRMRSLETEVRVLRLDVDVVKATVNRLEARVGGLENRVGGLENRVGGLEEKVDGMNDNIVRLMALVTELIELHASESPARQ